MTEDLGPGPHLTDMVRRLRARPVSSWQLGDREAVTRAATQRLADLAAHASGEPRRVVPDVGVLALPDQLAVLAEDARVAGVPTDTVTGILHALAAELGLR